MYDIPNTGDKTNLTLYITMLVIALIIMIGIAIHSIVLKKYDKSDDKNNNIGEEFKYKVSDGNKGVVVNSKNESDREELTSVTMFYDEDITNEDDK